MSLNHYPMITCHLTVELPDCRIKVFPPSTTASKVSQNDRRYLVCEFFADSDEETTVKKPKTERLHLDVVCDDACDRRISAQDKGSLT